MKAIRSVGAAALCTLAIAIVLAPASTFGEDPGFIEGNVLLPDSTYADGATVEFRDAVTAMTVAKVGVEPGKRGAYFSPKLLPGYYKVRAWVVMEGKVLHSGYADSGKDYFESGIVVKVSSGQTAKAGIFSLQTSAKYPAACSEGPFHVLVFNVVDLKSGASPVSGLEFNFLNPKSAADIKAKIGEGPPEYMFGVEACSFPLKARVSDPSSAFGPSYYGTKDPPFDDFLKGASIEACWFPGDPLWCPSACQCSDPPACTSVECTYTAYVVRGKIGFPVIQTPGDLTVASLDGSPMVVTYPVSATDAEDGPIPVTCQPASGSLFDLGATAVNCTASDSAGNVASATFHVIVTTDPNRSGGGTIPAGGGEIGTPDGSVNIVVPAGAVPPGTYLSIAATGTSYELTSNLGNGTAVYGVVIQPEGTQFNVPITITFRWSDADNNGVVDGSSIKEANLIITKDNVAVTGRCKVEPGCDQAANEFKFQVSSLSVFALVFVDELGPLVSNVAAFPNPAPVGSAVTLTAVVDDTGQGGTPIFSGEYSIDGGPFLPMAASDGAFDSVQEAVVATLPAFTEPAVHVVCVRGWDAMRNWPGSDECIYLPVYDPTAGFVTGGGWIISPIGAYVPDPELTGKASFGFVSKYLKGAKVPSGQTQFDFQVAALNFHSSSYEWLVVAGARAQYKGTGTVNGNGSYKFLLTAIDADANKNDAFTVDRFRIKIWGEDASGVEHVVYDNARGVDADAGATPIGGGSIIVHTK